jgi:hypothetical protein
VNITFECADGEFIIELQIMLEQPLPKVLHWNGRTFEYYQGVVYREILEPNLKLVN